MQEACRISVPTLHEVGCFGYFPDLIQLFVRQLHVESAEVLLKVLITIPISVRVALRGEMKAHLDFGGARDRDDVFTLAEKPCERNLARGRVVTIANLLQAVGKLENIRKVLFRVPGACANSFSLLCSSTFVGGRPCNLAPEIILVKVLWAFVPSSD